MQLEIVRIVADWLRDPVNGVNALLPGIPLVADDAATPPPPVLIEDETRQPDPATRRVNQDEADQEAPYDKPILSVLVSDPGQSDDDQPSSGADRDARATLLVWYLTPEKDEATAMRHASYTLRAALQSLRRLHQVDPANRTLNHVTLWYCTGIQTVRVKAEREDSIATSGLMARYVIRDTQPIG